jgi:hypothetical protein
VLLHHYSGRLPSSLGWVKHDQLIASGVLGGDAVRIFKLCSCKSRYARLGVGSVRCAPVAHPRSPGKPGDGLVAQRACPAAAVGTRIRSE